MTNTVNTAAASGAADNCTILPDGSAFAVGSFPLPQDHWLYAPHEYEPGADEPKELLAPILTHAQRNEVVAAVRYAVRGATMCGKEPDFDPDALVQNAVYALCGPFGRAALATTAQATPAAAPTTQPAPQQEAQEPVARLEIGKTKGGVSLTHIAEPAAFQLPEGMYALYTTPQPTQAQAGAEPLTDEQKNAMWVAATIELPSPQSCYLRGMADAERAHGIGIKGGQHGTE